MTRNNTENIKSKNGPGCAVVREPISDAEQGDGARMRVLQLGWLGGFRRDRRGWCGASTRAHGTTRPVCDADNDEAEMSSPRSKGYKKTNLLSRDTYRRRKRAELEAGKTLGSRTNGCVRRRNYSIELQTAVHTETAVHTGDDSMSCAPDDQATRHDTTQQDEM